LLGAILRSLRGGVIVLDSDLRVLSWNRQSEELWGLRDDEAVGRHFYSLDIGLPLDATRPLVRRLLSAGTVEEGRGAEGSEVGESVELDAHNRRGRPIRVRVTGSPLLTPRGSVSGAVLVTEIVATTGWAAPEEAPDVPDDQN
jgi:two-component system CheB/CheR fusion protein